MAFIWTDVAGQKWEIEQKADVEHRHRKLGGAENKWRDGYPPGWIVKGMIPNRIG